MGIIRKRPLASRDPCNVASGDEPEAEGPAQPLDERASSSPAAASADDVPGKRLRRSRRSPDVTRPLTIVRLQSKPKQLAHVNEGGAPDWSLGAGVATVLFGFVIAFGTYAVLTQREAMQSRLHHFAEPDKPHLAKRDGPASPGQSSVDIAQMPRAPLETPPIAVAVRETQMPNTAASYAAGSSATVAHGAPLPTPVARRDALAARPNPVEKRTGANASVPSVREAPKAPAQALTTNVAQARTASAIQKDRRDNPKATKTACGALKPCDEAVAHDEHASHDPVTVRSPSKSSATTTVIREAAVAVSVAPANQITPPPAQAEVKTEAAVSLPLAVNKDLFRQH